MCDTTLTVNPYLVFGSERHAVRQHHQKYCNLVATSDNRYYQNNITVTIGHNGVQLCFEYQRTRRREARFVRIKPPAQTSSLVSVILQLLIMKTESTPCMSQFNRSK